MVILSHNGSPEDDIDPLNFVLVGVFDMEYAMKVSEGDVLFDFFMKGHPTKILMTHGPTMTKSLNEGMKQKGDRNVPFGIFFATKEINPESDIPLIDNEKLVEYREKYPFLRFENWTTWDEVVLAIDY